MATFNNLDMIDRSKEYDITLGSRLLESGEIVFTYVDVVTCSRFYLISLTKLVSLTNKDPEYK